MPVRFYLSQLTGDGTPGPGAWRPIVTDAIPGVAWSALDGRPAKGAQAGWVLVLADVTAAQHAAASAVVGAQYVPLENAEGVPLGPDDPISAVPASVRQTMRDRLEARGVPTQDFTLQTTPRDVWRRVRLRFLLRHRLASLDFVEGLDTLIRDIAPARRQAISARLAEEGFDTSVLSGGLTIREALRLLLLQSAPVFRERAG